MKQHYLPKFYLDGFTEPHAEKLRTPYCWLYYRCEGRWKKRAPKNIATKTDLYSITDDEGTRHDELEKFLSSVESQTAKIMASVIAKGRKLEGEDRQWLALFIAVMFNRLPAYLDQWVQSIIQVETSRMELLRGHPLAFYALKKQYEHKTGKKLPDSFGPEHLDPKRYKIVPSKEFVLSLALSPVNLMAKVLADMSWTLLSAPGDSAFVTSDYPSCAVNPRLQGTPYGPGLLQRNVELTLPISRTIAMVIAWGGKRSCYLEATPPQVREVNIRTISGASEFIVSPTRDFPGTDMLTRWADARGEDAENTEAK